MSKILAEDNVRNQILTNFGTGLLSFNCQTIEIGCYKFTPKAKVHISAKSVIIFAPHSKNKSTVALTINLRDVKTVVNFYEEHPVIHLYTTKKCCANIRKMLNLTREGGSKSEFDTYGMIKLLPETITEELKTAIKILLGTQMDVSQEAHNLLERTCPKDSGNITKPLLVRAYTAAANSSGPKSANPVANRQYLIYPPAGKGGIQINTEDYMCLAKGNFLNDVIVNFYLNYLLHDVLTRSQKEKTHLFSTFFYKSLSTIRDMKDSNLTLAQKRHLNVKTWTKNVNIFEKDYIVVPVNENFHWFVAIICFPSLDGCQSMLDNRSVCPQEIKNRERTPLAKNTDSNNHEAEADVIDLDSDSDEEEIEKPPANKKPKVQATALKTEPIKQPCILIFDSLGASRSKVVATLRDYLTCEYQAKVNKTKVFNKDNIKESCPIVPQQTNSSDCGLYLLQYVEQFFKDPILDYTLPIPQLSNWFDKIVVTRKREEIANLIKTLQNKYN